MRTFNLFRFTLTLNFIANGTFFLCICVCCLLVFQFYNSRFLHRFFIFFDYTWCLALNVFYGRNTSEETFSGKCLFFFLCCVKLQSINLWQHFSWMGFVRRQWRWWWNSSKHFGNKITSKKRSAQIHIHIPNGLYLVFFCSSIYRVLLESASQSKMHSQ